MTDLYNRLLRFNNEPLPENFVALASSLGKDNTPVHAAILIRHQGRNYLHHFPGSQPPLVEDNFISPKYIYLYKMLSEFEDEEDQVGAVLEYCRFICEKSEMTYSMIMDGSKYSFAGDFESASGLPELGTCVGFCVTTLASILQDCDTYFVLSDWPASTVLEGAELNQFGITLAKSRFPELDWAKYDSYNKRISPLEYLASGFIPNYPILKSEVDEIVPAIQELVKELV